jgi:hypothetical protein
MLHPQPKTPAEHFARHLEENYSLQLDDARYSQLLKDIEERFKSKEAPVAKR